MIFIIVVNHSIVKYAEKDLLASGYSVGGQEKEILEDGCNGFIQKPFRMESLSMKIQELMERDCDRTSGIGVGRSCTAAEAVPDNP